MNKINEQKGYAAYISEALAKTLTDMDIKENVRSLRLSALAQLMNRLMAYSEHGYMDRLLDAIAHKNVR